MQNKKRIRKDVKLTSKEPLLYSLQLYYSRKNETKRFNALCNELLRYYLYTGTYYQAGSVQLETTQETSNDRVRLFISLDPEDSKVMEWYQSLDMYRFGSEVKRILERSFVPADTTCLIDINTLRYDLLHCNDAKTAKFPTVTDAATIDKLMKLLSDLNMNVDKDKLDTLLREVTNVPSTESSTTTTVEEPKLSPTAVEEDNGTEAGEDNEADKDKEMTKAYLGNLINFCNM